MEPVSLVVGILPLLSLCFEVLERVTSFREFGSSSRRLSARFASTKLRFHDWTIGVGFINGSLIDPHNPQLDRPEVIAIVKTILTCLRETFRKAESFNDKLSAQQDRSSSLKRISASALSTRDALSWAVRGKAVFAEDVDSFEILVDRLYELVPLQDLRTVVVNNVKIDAVTSASSPLTSLQSIETLQQEILLTIQATHKDAKFEALRTIDDWLDTPAIDQELEKHLEARLEGTCDWIFGSHTYLVWESDDFPETSAKTLWVHGPAGHGKTVLCAAVIRRFKEQANHNLAFFFSTPHVQGGHQPLSILRIWIAQLCRINADVLNVTRERVTSEHASRRATQAELWSLLAEIVAGLDQCILILDGLDEFPQLDESRSDFLHRLKEAIRHTQTRLMISSRPATDLESELSNSASPRSGILMHECRVSADVLREDIARFSRKIVADQLPRQSPEQQTELANNIAQKCQGMFLWIKMQKPHLRAGKSRKQLLKVIESMPAGLTQTYNRDWSQIQSLADHDRRRAIDILRWTCYAMYPLTVGELTEALVHTSDMADSCEEDLPEHIDEYYVSGEIKALCGSLIEVRAADSATNAPFWTTHLIHFSAKEFLATVLPFPLSTWTAAPGVSAEARHHMHLAEICMRYLVCNKSWRQKSWDDRVPPWGFFLPYASFYWYLHRKEVSGISQELCDLSLQFFDPKNAHFGNWTEDDRFHKSAWTIRQHEDGLNSRLYMAVLFDLPHIMENLRDYNRLDFTPTSFTWGTALAAASWMEDVVFDQLVKWGADVNVTAGHHGNALCTAIAAGSAHKVRTLLANGANTNVFDRNGRSSLALACQSDNTDIVRTLLEHDTEMIRKGDVVTGPFFEAIGESNETIVRLLLEYGIDVNIVDNARWTGLHQSCLQSDIEIVQLLLDAGADASRQTKTGCTPLCLAVQQGWSPLVELLLSYHADPSAPANPDCEFGELTSTAILDGNVQMLQVLLEAGAPLNTDGHGVFHTLGMAIEMHNLVVLEALVEAGMDLTFPIYMGRTPFEWVQHVWPEHPKLATWKSQVKHRVDEQDRAYWLKREICDIVRRLYEDETDRGGMGLPRLTRSLIMLDAKPEAMFAGQQQIAPGKSGKSSAHPVVCDGCEAYPVTGSRHICKECPNVDICDSCLDQLERVETLKRCRQHQFFSIEGVQEPLSTRFGDRLGDANIRQWLLDILERFRVDGPEPPLVCVDPKAMHTPTTGDEEVS